MYFLIDYTRGQRDWFSLALQVGSWPEATVVATGYAQQKGYQLQGIKLIDHTRTPIAASFAKTAEEFLR
jgi:hypothetical protein